MTPEKLFHDLLGLGLQWEVVAARFDNERSTMALEIRETEALWAAQRCPKDGGKVTYYDHTENLVWRRLKVFQHRCEIHCQLPRGKCGQCGHVYRLRPPWEGLSRNKKPKTLRSTRALDSAGRPEKSSGIPLPDVSQDHYRARFLPAAESQTSATEGLAQARALAAEQQKEVILRFDGERQVTGNTGCSILENSLKGGIDHIFVCGGNARCSTCRVLILEGLENCLPRNSAERKLARLKSFSDEVRLACQTRVTGDIRLRRLVFDQEDIARAQRERGAAGREQHLAVLFSDIRSFTPFAEAHLPYDVVHMLDRYFNAIGKPIDANHGYIDKYMGDGIMVLFGLNPGRVVDPCVDAVQAALGMLEELRCVNDYLEKHFEHRFQIGIGIHYGPAIVGEIGFALKRDFTALGDTVNLASRIESETKKAGATILISDDVFQRVKNQPFPFGRKFKSRLKGKSGQQTLHEICSS